MDIRGKKALVIGLQRSGVGAANLLKSLGAEVTVTDKKPKEGLREFIVRLLPSVKFSLGGHPDELFIGANLIVVSPGVPMNIPQLKAARASRIKIIGELELAFQTAGQILRAGKEMPFFAVTGTNGKSTTTMLLDLMLRKTGINTMLGGNIGNALTEELLKAAGGTAVDCMVVEVSSFQLESIDMFRPRGAAILNITPDHLDRYHSMAEYRAAKKRITLNQTAEDFLVLNNDDPETMKVLDGGVKAGVVYFSRKQEVKGVFLKDGTVYQNLSFGPRPLIGADDIRIKGVHNLENAMAASAMALLAGCHPDAIKAALLEFGGLSHRLEFVRELDGVRYINDSKGTNVGAVLKSIESFNEPLILIAGGRDKAGDFKALRGIVKGKVRTAVLIGEAGEKIKNAIGDLTECRFAGSMDEAVKASRSIANAGDVVLLSPACASFDMFKDFEDRGDKFKKAVLGL